MGGKSGCVTPEGHYSEWYGKPLESFEQRGKVILHWNILLQEMGRSLERGRKPIQIRMPSGPKEVCGKTCVDLYMIYCRTWTFFFSLGEACLRSPAGRWSLLFLLVALWSFALFISRLYDWVSISLELLGLWMKWILYHYEWTLSLVVNWSPSLLYLMLL